MKSKRIENDLHIAWTITMNGEAVSLENRQLALSMRSALGWQQVKDFSVAGNVVSFLFRGADQKVTGVYLLKLQETTGGRMRTIDVCRAFQLVPHSYQEDDEAESDIDDPSVALKSDVQIGPKGDPMRFEDLTEEQIAILQRPATAAAARLDDLICEWGKAEKERTGNETERVDSERVRQNAEEKREKNEALRVSAEQERRQSEITRTTAETDRNNRFVAFAANAEGALAQANAAVAKAVEAGEKALEAAKNVKNGEKGKDGKDGEDGWLKRFDHGTADTTFALRGNEMHIWGEVEQLKLTLAPYEKPDVTAEYAFQFSTPPDAATAFLIPETVKWYKDYKVPILPGMIYTAMIYENIIYMGGVTR